ncbi:MAG: hypothetical protein DNFNHJIP_00082 [Candidatus Argoarchaeum ethanivorans]|uniref:Polyphosphate kinase-2-related domain-containing protein n=1 Tax=Candidatus Argoarchaeum ethanivorans TaxID=2608793 RepID=A0A812A0L8_9EURY|nr:MAG: hypothetical protein DNFNHJIP_00082 [Candidatus Argoarchaeum ethanivorans]
MTEVETNPKGPRVRIRDVVKNAEPGVEPTILQNLIKKEKNRIIESALLKYYEAEASMLQKTHTKTLPWYIIRSDDKHLARLETFKIILSLRG